MTALALAGKCGGFGASGVRLRRREQALLAEQVGEREAGDAAAQAREQLAAW